MKFMIALLMAALPAATERNHSPAALQECPA